MPGANRCRAAQVGLLAKYNITINDSVLKQLEDGPLAWKGLKKKMFQK